MSQSSQHPRRGDLDGLRAVAVLAVVVNHFFEWPLGGFIGVDVFYVLSGFLITGILVREFGRTGWISFQHFYIRRVKRILPAALLVLAATVAVAHLVWYPTQARQVLLDGVAGLLFASNWHFIRLRTDYLAADGPVSPVQHFWSLAVEEQFYIVWPLLILGVAVWALKRQRSRSRHLAAWMVAVAVLSFAWSLGTSFFLREFAYFDTVSRVWELAAGAILAVTIHRLRLSEIVARSLAWSGLILIVVGAFVVLPSWPFPGPWALVPVVGSLLIIAGGHQQRGIVVLTNPVSQYVGRISYSLYLWHFPVIVFANALFPGHAISTTLAAIIVAFGLSALSYRYVEVPVIRSAWLRGHVHARRRMQVIGALAVGALVIAVSAVQLVGPFAVVSSQRPIPSAVADIAIDPAWVSEQALAAATEAAADSTSWPAVDLASVDDGLAVPAMNTSTGCRNSFMSDAEPKRCEFDVTSPEGTVLVIGDSVGVSWLPAVVAALPTWNVVGLGFADCPAIPVRVDSGTRADRCASAQETMMDEVRTLQPDLVITSNSQRHIEQLESGASGQEAELEWQDAVARFVGAARETGASVAILSNPPSAVDPAACLTRFAAPSACAKSVDATFERKSAAERAGAAATNATFVDVSGWLCDAERVCPMVIGTTVVRYDGAHLTAAASANLGGILRTHLPVE